MSKKFVTPNLPKDKFRFWNGKQWEIKEFDNPIRIHISY